MMTDSDIRWRNMHKVVESYLKAFCKEMFVSAEIDKSKQFELFSNYCVVKSFYPDEVNAYEITSDNDDAGIDGVCFLVDGEIVTTVDEAKSVLQRPKRSIPVDVYFVQTKTSETYDRGQILKFGDGVCDFVSNSSNLPQGDFLKNQKAILDLLVTNISKIAGGRPIAHLKYVCTSNNAVAAEIEATRKNIVFNVERTGFFQSVDFDFVGLEELIDLWNKTRDPISAVMQTKQLSPYPEMPGVTEAYLAVVPLKSFVESVLMDNAGHLRTHIFEENVRAFLGEGNSVNMQIRNTLADPEAQKRFAILNNGITIISPDVRVQNDKVSLESYQIVNGCQTSNILFENYDVLLPGSTITVRVIEATNQDVIADVVRATNSQSKVDETQFMSFFTLTRRLERYFAATSDIAGKETQLYFERRAGQYKDTNVVQNRVCSMSETFRAVGAMFLRKPELACRYPSRMVSELQERLLDANNKEIAYYAAALALYRFKLLVSNGSIPLKYSTYRWHILMLIGCIVSKGTLPPIHSKKIEDICAEIIKICSQSDDKCVALFSKAIKLLNSVGLKESRDDLRSTTYTQSILHYYKENAQNNTLCVIE